MFQLLPIRTFGKVISLNHSRMFWQNQGAKQVPYSLSFFILLKINGRVLRALTVCLALSYDSSSSPCITFQETEVFIWQEGGRRRRSLVWVAHGCWAGISAGPLEPVRSQSIRLRCPALHVLGVAETVTHLLASLWLIFFILGVEIVMITVLTVLLPQDEHTCLSHRVGIP